MTRKQKMTLEMRWRKTKISFGRMTRQKLCPVSRLFYSVYCLSSVVSCLLSPVSRIPSAVYPHPLFTTPPPSKPLSPWNTPSRWWGRYKVDPPRWGVEVDRQDGREGVLPAYTVVKTSFNRWIRMMLYSSFSLWRAWKRTTRDKNSTNTAMTHDTLLNNMTRWRVTHRKTMTRWRVTRWRMTRRKNYDAVTHDTLLNTMTRWRVTHHKTMTRWRMIRC